MRGNGQHRMHSVNGSRVMGYRNVACGLQRYEAALCGTHGDGCESAFSRCPKYNHLVHMNLHGARQIRIILLMIVSIRSNTEVSQIPLDHKKTQFFYVNERPSWFAVHNGAVARPE